MSHVVPVLKPRTPILPDAWDLADLRLFERLRLRHGLSLAFSIFRTYNLSMITLNDLCYHGNASCSLFDHVDSFCTMTSYTRAAEGEQPTIYTTSEHTISRINPLIYGGFTEYVLLACGQNGLIMEHF
jgi:hypothetical protein